MFYPYLASYTKLSNPDVTMKTFFTFYVFSYVGYGCGSQLTNLYLYLFNFKQAMIVNALISVIVNIGFVYCSSSLGIIICIMLMGSTLKVIITLTTLFFKENYNERANIETAKCSGGKMFGSVVFTILFSYIINPGNKGLKWAVEEEGVTNMYYSEEISSNISFALFLHGLWIIILYSIAYIVIPESTEYRGLNSQKNESEKDIELIEQNPENNINYEEPFSYWNELTSFKFIILFVLSILRLSENLFIIDNFKLQGVVLTDNDHLLNQVFAFSGILSVFSRMGAGWVLNKLGNKKVHTIVFMSMILVDLLYIFLIEHSFTLFALTMCYIRLLLNLTKTSVI